jgi:hypothetical protein
MSNLPIKPIRIAWAIVIATGFAAAGCAGPANQNASRAPRVQDCGVVAISSPPKYACEGKVYTSMQLAKLRNDEARKYQSGK